MVTRFDKSTDKDLNFAIGQESAEMLGGADHVASVRDLYRTTVFRTARCWSRVKGVEWQRVKDPLFTQCPQLPERNVYDSDDADEAPTEDEVRIILTQDGQDSLLALGVLLLESDGSLVKEILTYLLQVCERLHNAEINKRKFSLLRKYTSTFMVVDVTASVFS